MTEKQSELNLSLNFICQTEYDGDKKRMLLDLSVIIGRWAEEVIVE